MSHMIGFSPSAVDGADAMKMAISFGLLGSLLLVAGCSKRPSSEPQLHGHDWIDGNAWLAWTPGERDRYTDAFLAAYTAGWADSCVNSEAKDWLRGDVAPTQHEKARGVLLVAERRCLDAAPQFSAAHRTDAGKIDLGPYVPIVTEMYEKHPDARSLPYFFVLPFLKDGGAKSSEELYQAQLNQLPNVR
jgi:hypothetical protein